MLKKLMASIICGTGLLSAMSASALDAPPALVPAGLTPGTEFYVIFATSGTTAATNNTIAFYNSFVNTQADLSSAKDTDHASITWIAVGATAGNDQCDPYAGDATATAMYNTNGVKVADDRADILDGSLDAAVGFDQAGSASAADVWTGCQSNGTALGAAELGTANPADGVSNVAGATWNAGAASAQATTQIVYAVSPKLTVPQPSGTITQSGTAASNVSITSTAAQLKAVASATVVNTVSATAAARSLQVGDKINIVVSGAKFDRAALAAVPVTLTDGAVATWTLDAATDTILTGTVTTQSGTDSTVNTMTLTGLYELTGVGTGTDVTIKTTVSRLVLGVDSVVSKILSNLTDFIDLTTTPSLQKVSLAAAEKNTATVASSFVKVDTVTGTDATIVVSTTTLPITVLADYNAANATGTLFYKLTGVPAAVQSIAYAPAGFTQSDATGLAAPTTPTAAGDFWLDGNGNAFAKVAAANSKAAVAATAMTLTFDGTTAVIPSNLSLQVDYIAGAADKFVSHTPQAATVIAKVVRNGSAFSLNSTGPLNTLKITDLSGALTVSTGKISVTAYDAAGVAVAGSPVIDTLTSNSTVSIAGSTLTDAFTGAVRFDFVVESTEISASNVKKTTAGTTVTTYRNSSDSIGTVTGNGTL